MPHSISGIYSLFYANNYPDEIQGIIGIDTAVPKQYKLFERNTLVNKFMESTLLTKLIRKNPDIAIKMTRGKYSNDELNILTYMYKYKYRNNSIKNEYALMQQNMKEIVGETFPVHIPTAFILADKTKKQIYKILAGENWIELHKEQIKNNKYGLVEEVEGTHYLHWKKADKIKSMLDSLCEKVNM